MCQKAVGGPFITLVQLRPGQIAWTRGTPGEFRSSTIATRLFCRDCGTPLAYVDDDTGALEVTSGSLDDPARAVPTRATGTEAMLHWIGGVTSLPSRTTEQNLREPQQAPGRLVPASRSRYAAGLDAAAWRMRTAISDELT